MKNIFCMLALLVFFAGCGEAIKHRASMVKEIPLSDQEVKTLKLYQSFSCDSLAGEQCPTGLGRVIVLNYKNKNKTKICSAFLTSKNTMVTNHHCVSTQADCNNAVISIFNGTNAEITGCKRIIYSKSDSVAVENRGIDVTVLELKSELNIEPLKVSRNSANPGESLTVWAVDQISAFTARITELNCQYSSKSNAMLLTNCPAIGGNSGSPVFNSYREIVGIVFAGTDRFKNDEETPLSLRRGTMEETLSTDILYFRHYLAL